MEAMAKLKEENMRFDKVLEYMGHVSSETDKDCHRLPNCIARIKPKQEVLF